LGKRDDEIAEWQRKANLAGFGKKHYFHAGSEASLPAWRKQKGPSAYYCGRWADLSQTASYFQYVYR